MIVVFCCCGCFPYHFTISPSVAGRIVDDNTGAPVDGAEVIVSRASYEFSNNAFDPVTHQLKPGAEPQPPPLNEAIRCARPPVATTTADGAFAIPPQKRWGLYIIPMDLFEPRGSLVIRRQGYQDVILSVSSWRIINLGAVRLKRVQP